MPHGACNNRIRARLVSCNFNELSYVAEVAWNKSGSPPPTICSKLNRFFFIQILLRFGRRLTSLLDQIYRGPSSLDQVFGYQSDTGYGLVMMTGNEEKTGQAEFLGVGKGFRVIITSRTPGKHIGFATIDDSISGCATFTFSACGSS